MRLLFFAGLRSICNQERFWILLSSFEKSSRYASRQETNAAHRGGSSDRHSVVNAQREKHRVISMSEGTVGSKKRTYMSRESASALLSQCDKELDAALHDLREAKELAERAGLWTDSSILDPTFPDTSRNLAALLTTGGHSNTDHVVTFTGDARTDRIAELKRAMQKRAKAMQPENKGEDRWDKPRIPGERRRRIVREKDMPQAPPEPPPSGYVIFVGQMTTKIRHDRPDEPHNQIKGTVGSVMRKCLLCLRFLNVFHKLIICAIASSLISCQGNWQNLEIWNFRRRSPILQ